MQGSQIYWLLLSPLSTYFCYYYLNYTCNAQEAPLHIGENSMYSHAHSNLAAINTWSDG